MIYRGKNHHLARPLCLHASGWLRSIVPMFGGGTQYVQTLDAILEFVGEHQPMTDELVGWYRGSFPKVGSRDSIMRRVSYLQQVGFLRQENDHWNLGEAGQSISSFCLMCRYLAW